MVQSGFSQSEAPLVGTDVDSIIQVTSRRTEVALVVSVTGELDLWSASHLDDALLRAVEHADSLLICLDLSEVTFVDLSGWRPISDASDVLQSRGDQLLIVDLSDRVRRFLELVGLDDAVRITPTGVTDVTKAPVARADPIVHSSTGSMRSVKE